MLEERIGSPEEIRFGMNPQRVPHWDYPEGVVIPAETWMQTSMKAAPRDIFGRSTLPTCEFYSPVIDIAELIKQLGRPRGDTYRQWPGLKPVPDDLGVADRVRRGSAFWHNVKAMFTNWKFVRPDPPSVDGENAVTHANIIGKVNTNVGDAIFLQPNEWPFGEDSYYSTPKTHATVSRITGDDDSGFWYLEPAYDRSFENSAPERSIRAFLDNATVQNSFFERAYHPSGASFFEDSNVSSYSQLRYSTVPRDDLSISEFQYRNEHFFRYTSSEQPYIREQWWSSIHKMNIEWLLTPHLHDVDDIVDLATLVNARITFTVTRTHYAWRGYNVPDSPSSWGFYDPGGDSEYVYTYDEPAYIASLPLTLGYGDDSGVPVLLDTTYPELERKNDPYPNFLVRKYYSTVLDRADMLFPATFYSSKEAVDQYLEELEANHLENLSQLGQIRGLITPVKGVTRLASAIIRRNAIDSVLALADLLADAKLLWSFGIAPTLADAQELSDHSEQLIRTLRSESLFAYKTFNGKFSIDLPDHAIPPYTGAKLVARSKVRGRLNPNSLLAALMPLDSFGLLPTLSHMWDLVPFSFVADWFTRTGDRLEDVDTVVKILALDVRYSVHSVKVYWDIDGELLDVANVATEPGSDAQLTYYVRSVMRRVPTLSYTDIDFRPAGGVPDWGTFASLVWKLFR